MNFKNLHNETDCDCLSQTIEDTTSTYIRKLKKTQLNDNDFYSHWERGIGNKLTKCNEICSHKGISINNASQIQETKIYDKYRTTFNINPAKGAYIIKFKFKSNSGKVKHTPSSDNPSHYDFYKSDEFKIENIDIIDTIKIT